MAELTTTTDRLMRLLDAASDFVLPDTTAFEWRPEYNSEVQVEQMAYHRAQAAALAAIALLLLRQDEDMNEEWQRY